MKIVSTEKIRELDRLTIEKFGVPGALLMERAGQGIAAGVIRLSREHHLAGNKALLIAGHGNNGGDAFVAARFLKDAGFAVQVLLAGEKAKLRGDALCHFRKMTRHKVPFKELKSENDWHKLAAENKYCPEIIVDGVLGTGLEGKARGVAAAAIRFINALSGKSLVVAIDIPSGLDSDTGDAKGDSPSPSAMAKRDSVRADLTITLGLPKKGLVEQSALEYVGRVEVVDIGLPSALTGKIKDITSSAITIQVKNGTTRMAAISDQTIIIRNGKTAKPNEMDIGDFIIAMGYADARDSFDAKRVIAQTDEPKSRNAKIIFGKITKINPGKNTFSITVNRPAELGGPEVIELSAVKTVVDLTKLNLEDKVIIITVPGKVGQPLTAKAVKIIK